MTERAKDVLLAPWSRCVSNPWYDVDHDLTSRCQTVTTKVSGASFLLARASLHVLSLPGPGQPGLSEASMQCLTRLRILLV